LKLENVNAILGNTGSRPARGAWIETAIAADTLAALDGRAPRGARGLKLGNTGKNPVPVLSRPARGAWIETVSAPI